MVLFANDVSIVVMHYAWKNCYEHLYPVLLLGQSCRMVLSILVLVVVVKA